MVVRLVVFALLVMSCDTTIEPLSREQLFGVPSVVPKVRLTGTITDEATQGPLAGVAVNLASVSALTDDTGSFTLNELATGDFEGSAVKSGYQRKNFTITLTPGTNRLNLVMSAASCPSCASLTGTVSHARTNAPLENALISVGQTTVRSNAAGVFVVDGLMVGAVEGSVVLQGFERKTFQQTLHGGSNRLDVSLTPIPCGGCATGLVCDVGSNTCLEPARISFNVTDACTGIGLSARVVIQGKATCSTGFRGFAELRDLLPGGPQVLAAGKDHYQAASVMVTLNPGFNAQMTIMMTPIGGCSVTPQDVPCVCDTAECQ